MPSSLGPAELLVILVFALIVLGPERLPEVGRQLGRALAEVRRWSQGLQSELRTALDTEPPPSPRTPTPLATPAPFTTPAPSPATAVADAPGPAASEADRLAGGAPGSSESAR